MTQLERGFANLDHERNRRRYTWRDVPGATTLVSAGLRISTSYIEHRTAREDRTALRKADRRSGRRYPTETMQAHQHRIDLHRSGQHPGR